MEGSATFLRSSIPRYDGVISFEPKLLLTSLTNYLPDYSRNDESEAILFLVSMKVGS